MNEDLYQLYLDEIAQIQPCTREDNAALAIGLARGQEGAKSRLVEGNLQAALSYAGEYRDCSVPLNDLVQEANMALILAVDRYAVLAAGAVGGQDAAGAADGQDTVGAVDAGAAFEQYLAQKIREALDAFIEQQKAETDAAKTVLTRVNVLKEVTQRMADELGREATLEELADKMKLTVDEIKEMMKLTLDALSVAGE